MKIEISPEAQKIITTKVAEALAEIAFENEPLPYVLFGVSKSWFWRYITPEWTIVFRLKVKGLKQSAKVYTLAELEEMAIDIRQANHAGKL